MKKRHGQMPVIIPNQGFYNHARRWWGSDDTRQKEEEQKQHQNQQLLAPKTKQR